jgi:hypothetical protein
MNNPQYCHCKLCEPEETFECETCKRIMPYCMGAADEHYPLCDDCVSDLYRLEEAKPPCPNQPQFAPVANPSNGSTSTAKNAGKPNALEPGGKWSTDYAHSTNQRSTTYPQPSQMLVLIKIPGNKASIIFLVADITRITPILLQGKLDCYGLELTDEPHRIKLTPAQFDRLLPFLGYVDLTRDMEEPEELTAPLDEEFNRTISELLDMAIASPSPRPQSNDPWLVLAK